MEMEMEVKDDLALATDRLNHAAAMFEDAASRFNGVELQASIGRHLPFERSALEQPSTVELEASLENACLREQQLAQRLAEAEQTIATLKAGSGRKTLAGTTASLATKEGVAVEAGALDTALRSLSLEQRIAVKAEMIRSGLLG